MMRKKEGPVLLTLLQVFLILGRRKGLTFHSNLLQIAVKVEDHLLIFDKIALIVYLDKKTHWQSKSLQKIERSIVLPSPIMKQATLHSQSPTRHKHYQPPSPLSTKKKNFKPNTMHTKKQIHQKTKEEKAQINNSLEKLK